MSKFCSKCGKEMEDQAVVCPSCGANQTAQQQAAPQQAPIIVNVENTNTNVNTAATVGKHNKWVALILCWFLGVLGAHRFYEGKIISGIIYLLTFGLLGVGVFIDFFIILFKPTYY